MGRYGRGLPSPSPFSGCWGAEVALSKELCGMCGEGGGWQDSSQPGGLMSTLLQEAGAEDSQLWRLHLALQGQEPSGRKGLGGLKTR